MDFLPEHKYFQVNTNTLEEVRRQVNLDRPGEMKEAVRILQEWIHQQPHFKKKDFSVHYLEITIITSKGSIEGAKTAIDSACTIRTLVPKLFKQLNPKDGLQNIWDKTYVILLPKLCPNNSRIMILKLVGKYNKIMNVDDLHNYLLMLCECTRLHDYYAKTIIIVDVSGMDIVDALVHVNLFETKRVVQIILESYKLRIERIHIITESKLIERFTAFFRTILSKKIMDRLEVNKSFEELHQYYPKEMLPKDYGGNEKSISELNDECLELYSSEEYLEHMKSMMDALDESLRPPGQFTEFYAGTMGTFRTLTVD